jgi:outer membrane protein W
MKYFVTVVVVAVVGLLVGTTASAGGIEAETVEVIPNTSFSYSSYSDGNDDLTITNLQLGGAFGYFFTNMFELQIGVIVDYTSIDAGGGDSASQTNTGMVGSLVLNFPTESVVVPYVGVGGGFVVNSGDVGSADKLTSIVPTVEGGMRFLVGNSASINLGVSYEHQNNALGVEDVSANVVRFNVGVSAFVSGGPAD